MYMQHSYLLLQHPDKTLATFVEQMKHLEHTLDTYMYSNYNMCNVPIYFCNIDIQHLQHPLKHLKHTIATCVFSVASACCLDEWRLIDVELDAGTELDAAERREGRRCGAHRWHGPRQWPRITRSCLRRHASLGPADRRTWHSTPRVHRSRH